MEEPPDLARSRSRRIPAVLWDASVEVRRLREDAARDAADLIAEARREADGIRRAAAASGREEGLAEASELCARAAARGDEVLVEAEKQLVDLAFAIAARVLARVVEKDREAVIEVAARALEAARERREISVRVHPDDIAALRTAEPHLLERMERARRIALREDAAVARGGVIVETEAGTIDARLDSQLAALRRGLEVTSP